jgi:hypothetical protein
MLGVFMTCMAMWANGVPIGIQRILLLTFSKIHWVLVLVSKKSTEVLILTWGVPMPSIGLMICQVETMILMDFVLL